MQKSFHTVADGFVHAGNKFGHHSGEVVKVELVTDRIEAFGQDAAKCKKNAIPSTGTSLAQLTFNF